MIPYLFGFICLSTLLLGFGPLASETKTHLFQSTAFYLIALSVCIWLATLRPKTIAKQNIIAHLPALILATLLIITISFLVPAQLRILYDETNLLGVSQSMYTQQQCAIPTQAYFDTHNIQVLTQEWGIRPFTFPFFLYLIHLIKGYALTNVFILNALAGFAALIAFYFLLHHFFIKPLALLGMMMLSAYPIFALWTTSGGFEIVNLAFALLAFYQLFCWLNTQHPHHATRLVFTLVLLAQVRYESALFFIAISPIALYFVIQNPSARPSKLTIIAPILLLPVAWQRTLYSGDYAFMVHQGETMFGIHHFWQNLQHAFAFFGATHNAYGTLPGLFYIALIGIGIGLYQIYQKRAQISPPTLLFLLAIGFTGLLLSGAILGYILGNLTRPFSIRLGIIFLPFLLTPIIYLCHLLVNKKTLLLAPLTITTCFLIFYGWSIASQNPSVQNLRLYQINQAYTAFFQNQDPHKKALIISPFARLFVPDQRSAITFDYANQNRSTITKQLMNNQIDDIFICQIYNAKTGDLQDNTRLTFNIPSKRMGELKIGNDLLSISKAALK